MSKGGGAATHDKLAQAAFALATLFAFQLFKAVSGPFMVGVWSWCSAASVLAFVVFYASAALRWTRVPSLGTPAEVAGAHNLGDLRASGLRQEAFDKLARAQDEFAQPFQPTVQKITRIEKKIIELLASIDVVLPESAESACQGEVVPVPETAG
jgi:hypothetical protein